MTEQLMEIAANLASRDRTAVFRQYPVGLGEERRHRAPGVSPFVYDLLEDAGIRMLRDEAVAKHFDPLPSHFFDNGRIVQKPPASERQQVAEFPRVNAKLVLIFTA